MQKTSEKIYTLTFCHPICTEETKNLVVEALGGNTSTIQTMFTPREDNTFYYSDGNHRVCLSFEDIINLSQRLTVRLQRDTLEIDNSKQFYF